MREPLAARIKAAICRRFGHKPTIRFDQREASCRRCRRVLAGPVNFNTWVAWWVNRR